MNAKRVIIIGGGAAGFFAAIRLAECCPEANVMILEKGREVLSKVRVSGGGRCNVTHACFDPKQLVQYYPRGGKSLIGPFTRFNPTHTIEWFNQRGVELKTEGDGRMFPVTDNSETIVNCLLRTAIDAGVKVQTATGATDLLKVEDGWQVSLSDNTQVIADAVMIATGSSPQVWKMLQQLGIPMVEQVPSLFTFAINDARLQGLSGMSFEQVELRLMGTKISVSGPLLITHKGLSGPAVLRLSAWAAREMAQLDYKAQVKINFVPGYNEESCYQALLNFKQQNERKAVSNAFPFTDIPRRYREQMLGTAGIGSEKRWADVSNTQLRKLSSELCAAVFHVTGKNTFKEEFVTCGGVDLKAIDLRTMQIKNHPGLYIGGEAMDVDAVTGGFNFQHAWTSGYIAGMAMVG